MNNYFLFLEHRTFLVLHSFFLISGKKKELVKSSIICFELYKTG